MAPSVPRKRCFQVHPSDTVAVLLEDASQEPVEIFGGQIGTVELGEPIALGHKVAVVDIREGELVIKFGVPIGVADRPITRGAWVHLHNCRSQVDTRSSTLDGRTGVAM